MEIKGYIRAITTNKHGFVSLCVAEEGAREGVWVGVGGKKAIWKGEALTKGMTVRVEYDEDNWNNIEELEVLQKERRSNSGGGGGGYSKGGKGGSGGKGSYTRDTTGMEVGHALNGAFILTSHKKMKIGDEAKLVHDTTVKLKKVYAEANPDMSDYDVGAAVGHAVLNACRIISNSTKVGVEDLEKIAKAILSGPVVEITEYVVASKSRKPAKVAQDDILLDDDEDQEEQEEEQEEEEEEEQKAPPQKKRGRPSSKAADNAKGKPAGKSKATPPPVDTDDFDDIPF